MSANGLEIICLADLRMRFWNRVEATCLIKG